MDEYIKMDKCKIYFSNWIKSNHHHQSYILRDSIHVFTKGKTIGMETGEWPLVRAEDSIWQDKV